MARANEPLLRTNGLAKKGKDVPVMSGNGVSSPFGKWTWLKPMNILFIMCLIVIFSTVVPLISGARKLIDRPSNPSPVNTGVFSKNNPDNQDLEAGGDSPAIYYAMSETSISSSSADGREEAESLKRIIVVTATYPRPFQTAYLTQLATVLRLIPPPVVWIVVENEQKTVETSTALERAAGRPFYHHPPLRYVHLVTSVSDKDVNVARGVNQRNRALQYIEDTRLNGIIYLADDDNVYSAQAFAEIRKVKDVGILPVGMLYAADQWRPNRDREAFIEHPLVRVDPETKKAHVVGWHAERWSFGMRRRYHVDMAAFAFNSEMLWRETDPVTKRPTHPVRFFETGKRGRLETNFLDRLIADETYLEPLANGCREVWVWHRHQEAVKGQAFPRLWLANHTVADNPSLANANDRMLERYAAQKHKSRKRVSKPAGNETTSALSNQTVAAVQLLSSSTNQTNVTEAKSGDAKAVAVLRDGGNGTAARSTVAWPKQDAAKGPSNSSVVAKGESSAMEENQTPRTTLQNATRLATVNATGLQYSDWRGQAPQAEAVGAVAPEQVGAQSVAVVEEGKEGRELVGANREVEPPNTTSVAQTTSARREREPKMPRKALVRTPPQTAASPQNKEGGHGSSLEKQEVSPNTVPGPEKAPPLTGDMKVKEDGAVEPQKVSETLLGADVKDKKLSEVVSSDAKDSPNQGVTTLTEDDSVGNGEKDPRRQRG